jgi:ubiquinone/menaquinone biosynthesis C-methylase UbiE
MNLRELQRNWNKFGKQDPLYAILLEEDKRGNKWKLEDFFERGRQEIDQVMDYTTNNLGLAVQRSRALDFGCGVGRLTQAMASHFETVVGVDIAPSMLKGASKYNKFADRCQYVLNERDDLRLFESNSFDFIYSNRVLQHMRPEYCKSYLKEFIRVLRPDGLLIFYMPSEVLQQNSVPPSTPQPHTRSITLRRRVKQSIKDLTPKPILRFYFKLRYESQPVMEMYCVKSPEIADSLREHGGDILDTYPDYNTIPNTEGFRYAVTKH